MIIANDATVKAGAFFPMTCKKVLRAQRIAMENRLPLVYLVDSAGVFLPLQDEVFPDEDDFGRIFRNNAVISAAGIPQFAAIMGNCVAGGGYLPVLCDKLLMTEGSGLYLAGPGPGEGGDRPGGRATKTSAARRCTPAISGTIDFREPDEPACLDRLRRLVDAAAADTPARPPATWHPLGRPARSRYVRSVTAAGVRRPRPAAVHPRRRPRSTSTRPSTARRWSAATAGSAACRSASSPTSGSAASRPTGRCSSAA